MIDLHYWTTPNGHKITIFLEEAARLYGVLDRRLKGRPWLAGDDDSIADIAAFTWAAPYDLFGMSLAADLDALTRGLIENGPIPQPSPEIMFGQIRDLVKSGQADRAVMAAQAAPTFRLKDTHGKMFDRMGAAELGTINGEDSWTLPIPALYVIGEDAIRSLREADHLRQPQTRELVLRSLIANGPTRGVLHCARETRTSDKYFSGGAFPGYWCSGRHRIGEQYQFGMLNFSVPLDRASETSAATELRRHLS